MYHYSYNNEDCTSFFKEFFVENEEDIDFNQITLEPIPFDVNIPQSECCYTIYDPNTVKDMSFLSNLQYDSLVKCSPLAGLSINPIEMNLVPSNNWNSIHEVYTLEEFIRNHFQRRMTKKVSFQHKFWNALLITHKYPQTFGIIGATWLTDELILVNKEIFAKLLSIRRSETGLFGGHGMFLTHGFEEVNKLSVSSYKIDQDLSIVDFDTYRIVIDVKKNFTKMANEEQLKHSKWRVINEKDQYLTDFFQH